MSVAAHSADQWSAQLARLLPPGAAWTVPADGVFQRLLDALSRGLADAEADSLSLLDESDPLTAEALLADWERVAGLPDECAPIAGTVPARQAGVAIRLAATGGQSRAYYEALAENIGFEVTIEEYRPAKIGDAIGVRLYDDDWRSVWTVHVLAVGPNPADLECLIRRLKPAHTIVLFDY